MIDMQDSTAARSDGTDVAEAGGPRAIGRNQADGLRALFGDGAPAAYCIASSLMPDATATIGLGTAHALRKNGHRTLLVDEVPLFERQSLKGFAYPTRYDLGQVFKGDVALERALKRVAPNLWFATGVKVRKAVADHRARGPSLVERLRACDPPLDVVVITTCEPFGASISCYGDDVQRIVVSGADDASLTRALSHVRELSVGTTGDPVAVLMVGGAGEDVARAAFERLQRAAQSLLEQALVWNGWVRAASASAFGESDADGLVLPVSLYHTLARRIAAHGA
jgi:hypothetical protein